MSENMNKNYWKCPQEKEAPAEVLEAARDEFAEVPVGISDSFDRRNFLKTAGFTFAVGMLAGCSRAPVEKAIPFLNQPEEIIPGAAQFYATSCQACTANCGVLVKNRDGRPIKLEGNPEHPVSRGGLCAVGQASILGLYDSARYRSPLMNGKESTWEEMDRAVAERLNSVRGSRGAVRFLTGTITSPTSNTQLQRFLKSFADARQLVYDPLSVSAILEAHQATHGVRALPRYRFDRAEVIAGFDADFLGTWISPVEFTAGYRAGRNLEANPPRLSYHLQFESRMSLTGTKADRRIRMAPDEHGPLLSHLAARIAEEAGIATRWGDLGKLTIPSQQLNELARRLWESRGKSLIVSGSQDSAVQVLCNFINHLLGNYGATLDIARPSYQRQGKERELEALLREMESGKVAALFVHGVNPVFDLPNGEAFASALKKVPMVVSFAERPDETSALAHFVCPPLHFLEAWSDAEPVAGVVAVAQPALPQLGRTRTMMESLAAWQGAPRNAYDLIREHWQASVFPRQKVEKSFQAFWDHTVHDGFAQVEPAAAKPAAFQWAAVKPVRAEKSAGDELALVLYPKVGMLDGRHAHNPWLQELPDPITKVTWDNYACFSPATAARLGIKEGDVVRIDCSAEQGRSASLELPAYIQPGQHDAIVAVALGYGSKASERFAKVGPGWFQAKSSLGADGRVGKNAAPLLSLTGGVIGFVRAAVKITKTGAARPLACTQTYHTITVPANLSPRGSERRPIVQETTLPILTGQHAEEKHAAQHEPAELWPDDHPMTGHRWAMAIDLSACTGCSACVIACQAENNVPVVGRDEVQRRRIMHWMRIDRYYSGNDGDVDVAHQPMFCQQCAHAPCETVCPVLATVHSEEGLNQQVYNRCVGTRYCANNCPYKVRRFNWFDYPREDKLQNLSLNPDVAVRSRGVMEKCSFCVQRIQAAKIEAKQQGAKISDGAIQTACQQSCPAQAIVFGDLNDPKSRVSQLVRGNRSYAVLEEFNFQPSVGYLKLVRNRTDEEKHG